MVGRAIVIRYGPAAEYSNILEDSPMKFRIPLYIIALFLLASVVIWSPTKAARQGSAQNSPAKSAPQGTAAGQQGQQGQQKEITLPVTPPSSTSAAVPTTGIINVLVELQQE